MVYIFDCIYIPAHQANPEKLRHDYENISDSHYQIERNIRSICLHIELSSSLFCLTGI